jgi:3-oxoacyl-[acyl-carrier protein] reductase
MSLARAGFSVCINCREDIPGAEKTLSSMADSAQDSFIFRADVSDSREVDSMFSEIAGRWGRLDVLVNNAGIYERSHFTGIDFDGWRRTLSQNLDSVFLCTSRAVPMMMAQRHGRIINISSQLAFKGSRHGAHYAASKAGMTGFTRSLAIELGEYGITVNMIAPGSIRTGILDSYSSEQFEELSIQIPARRIGVPGTLRQLPLSLHQMQRRMSTVPQSAYRAVCSFTDQSEKSTLFDRSTGM